VGRGISALVAFVFAMSAFMSVLGAVLLTGYLGGAVSAHLRVGDPIITPIVIGAFVWIALYLRDRRLRVPLPLRT
jgi:hypothetical protein